MLDYIRELEVAADEANISKAKADAEEQAEIAKALQSEVTELKKRVAQTEEERANASWIAKVRAFDGVIDNPDEFGPKLRAIADFDEELATSVEKALALATERANVSSLFGEAGHNLPAPTEVEEQANAIAKSAREADPKLTEEEALAAVFESNPALYDEYVAKQRSRSRA